MRQKRRNAPIALNALNAPNNPIALFHHSPFSRRVALEVRAISRTGSRLSAAAVRSVAAALLVGALLIPFVH
jgi:hypothetical protein